MPKTDQRLEWIVAPETKKETNKMPFFILALVTVVLGYFFLYGNTEERETKATVPTQVQQTQAAPASVVLGISVESGEFISPSEISTEKFESIVSYVVLPPSTNSEMKRSDNDVQDFMKAALSGNPTMLEISNNLSETEKIEIKRTLLETARESTFEDVAWIQGAYNAIANGLNDPEMANELVTIWAQNLESETNFDSTQSPQINFKGISAPPPEENNYEGYEDLLKEIQPLTPMDNEVEGGYLMIPATPSEILRGLKNLWGAFTNKPQDNQCLYVLESYRYGILLFLTVGTSPKIETPHMQGMAPSWLPDTDQLLPNGVWAPSGTSWSGTLENGDSWDTVIVIWKGNPPFQSGETVCGSNILANLVQMLKK